MRRYQPDRATPRRLTAAETRRLKALPIDYSDIPPLNDEFFATATKTMQSWPPPKQQLTIRVDADVLTWLKGYGKGYQTRLNRILRAAILRAAMEGRPASTTASGNATRTSIKSKSR